jgi:hypothetical protein
MRKNENNGMINLNYALLAFVGVGSAAYHTRIKY